MLPVRLTFVAPLSGALLIKVNAATLLELDELLELVLLDELLDELELLDALEDELPLLVPPQPASNIMTSCNPMMYPKLRFMAYPQHSSGFRKNYPKARSDAIPKWVQILSSA